MSLKHQLNNKDIWALTVGMVISGQYFGWNYGLQHGSVLTMLLATIFVGIFYCCMLLCFAELATCFPQADGAGGYVKHTLGPFAGYLTSIASLIEYSFAPPAIAVACGAVLHQLFPVISASTAAMATFILFIFMNLGPIDKLARLESFAAIAALVGLIFFFCLSIPYCHISHLTNHNPSRAFHLTGIWTAIPFAMWLFLAAEGGAIAAEEMKQPATVYRGILSGMVTLLVFAITTVLLTCLSDPHPMLSNDYPLLHALQFHYSNPVITTIMAIMGLCGLIASLHGLIVAYSRQYFALARRHILPKTFLKTNRYGSPLFSVIIPSVFLIMISYHAAFAASLVLMSVFGACIMYMFASLAFIYLRHQKPYLKKSFQAPIWCGYISLILSSIATACVIIYCLPQAHFTIWQWHISGIHFCFILSVVIAIHYSSLYLIKNHHHLKQSF